MLVLPKISLHVTNTSRDNNSTRSHLTLQIFQKTTATLSMDFFEDLWHRPRASQPIMAIMRYVVGHYDGSADRSVRTWVLACADGKLYLAMKMGTIDDRRLTITDSATWLDRREGVPPVRFLPSALWPRARRSWTRYLPSGGDRSSQVYKKHKDPLMMVLESPHAYRNITDDDIHKLISFREIESSEYLLRHPHPNIAEYKGVECRSELVTIRPDGSSIRARFDTERALSLVFKKYSSNLEDWVDDGKPVSVTKCLTHIVRGIEYLHSLGLVHCDIKPDNIFVDNSNRGHISYVVGDFDSVAPEGSRYDLKAGDRRFSKHKEFHRDLVEKDDDWYAFEKTKKWLLRRLGRRERDYEHIGGPGRVRRF